MRDKHQVTEEPCEFKGSSTVLKTSEFRKELAEFTPGSTDIFQVLYFHEPDLIVENLMTDYAFLPEIEYFPVYGCYSLQFTKKYAPMGIRDYQFSQRLGDDFDELLSDNPQIEDEYFKISDPLGHKIGGYPDFVQGDPRLGNNPERDTDQNILLFQMDTSHEDEVHIMWGHGGV